MNEELERLETLERHGMLTHTADKDRLEELRVNKPAKKQATKKTSPKKKASNAPK